MFIVFWFQSDLSVGLGSGKLHSLPLSSVYTWGSGISAPLRLPMLNTEVLQVSLGRTQKMGVTKSGRLITWEVGADATLCLHFEDTQSPLLAFTSWPIVKFPQPFFSLFVLPFVTNGCRPRRWAPARPLCPAWWSRCNLSSFHVSWRASLESPSSRFPVETFSPPAWLVSGLQKHAQT